MELATWAVLLVLLLTMSAAYAAMARSAWNDCKVSKRNREAAEMHYQMTKAKYEAWLENSEKVGGSE